MKHSTTFVLAAALVAAAAVPAAAQSDPGWWAPRVLERGVVPDRDGEAREGRGRPGDVARAPGADRGAERGPQVERGPRDVERRPRGPVGRGNPGRVDDRGADERRDDDRREDEGRWEERGSAVPGGEGPAFCRSGEGHPVFGWEWCERKGWGGGYDVWQRQRGGWEDVILRRPTEIPRRMEEPALGTILGDIIFGRLAGHAERTGRSGPLEGRWVDLGARGDVLQVRAGGRPLAELTDVDRDGRADLVLLAGGR